MNALKTWVIGLLVLYLFCNKMEITDKQDPGQKHDTPQRAKPVPLVTDMMGWNPTIEGDTIKIGTMTVSNDKQYLYIKYSINYTPVGFWIAVAYVGDLKNLPATGQDYPYHAHYNVDSLCTFIKNWNIQIPLSTLKEDNINIVSSMYFEINWLQVNGSNYWDYCSLQDGYFGWAGKRINDHTHYVTYTIQK